MQEALNAVIYARYSSDRQTEQSIEGQLRECYAFAKANDIAVIDTYIDRAISGKTVKEICDILNSRGVKTARGGAFNKNSLHTILTNKKYIGIYKTKYGEIVGGIPAIIDKELFEMVALRMEQNKKSPCKSEGRNKLFAFNKVVLREMPLRYGWRKRHKQNGQEILLLCLRQEKARKGLRQEQCKKRLDRRFSYPTHRCGHSERRYYRANRGSSCRVAEGGSRRKWHNALFAKESIARRIISKEQIIYWISSFKGGDITSEKYRQQLIDTFVNAVFVYDDKIVITYNYSGENNTATISDLDLSSPPLQSNPNIFVMLNCFGLVVPLER